MCVILQRLSPDRKTERKRIDRLYSDRVNLNNLRINCDVGIKVFRDAPWNVLYHNDTSAVERFTATLYSHRREVQALTREDRDINGWLHFLP